MGIIFKAKDEVESANLILDEIQAGDTDTRERIKHAMKKLTRASNMLDEIIEDRNLLVSKIDKEHKDK